jgi:hypothetical protein
VKNWSAVDRINPSRMLSIGLRGATLPWDTVVIIASAEVIESPEVVTATWISAPSGEA